MHNQKNPDRTSQAKRAECSPAPDLAGRPAAARAIFAHNERIRIHCRETIGLPKKMDPALIDPNLVFAKTAAGEEAVLQRALVAQRNLRLVLILVDGNATVAELCDKTGNTPLTQNALLELEKNGFIEPRVDKDSVWRHGRDSARTTSATDMQFMSEFSTFGEKAPMASSKSPSSDSGEGRRSSPLPDSAQSRPSRSPDSLALQSLPSGPPSHGASLANDGVAAVRTLDGEPRAEAEAAVAAAPSLLQRLTALARPGTGNEPAEVKPIRRGGRRFLLTWPMGLLLGVLLLPAVLILAVQLFPYAHFLPAVEASLAQSTGQRAAVGDMRVIFYPRPGLLLDQVRLGDGADQITIGAIRLQPAIAPLLSASWKFGEAELSDVRLSAELLANLSRILSAAQGAGESGIPRITLSKTELSLAGLTLGELSGSCDLSADGSLETVSLHSPERDLEVSLQPTARGAVVRIEGLAWRPLPGSPIFLDSLSVQGEVEGPNFAINNLDLRIFGGRVRGTAVLHSSPHAAIAGEIAYERIDARKLGEALGVGSQFDGEGKGNLRFSATSPDWSAMLSAVQGSGNFTMHRGKLGGIDLAEALRRASPTPVTLGGSTSFEDLSGVIVLTPHASRFSRLVLNAGLLQASGQIDVDRDLQLHGRMEVILRGAAGRSVRPILISGPLKAPLTQMAGK